MIHLQVTTGTEGIVTLDCPEHKMKALCDELSEAS